LLLLLVLVARMRSRGFDDNEIEEAAVTATRQAIARASVPEPTVALPTGAMPRQEITWGSSEFGNAWGNGSAAEPTLTGAYRNGASSTKPSGDPWTSSW
jgi:hypothetical protein